MIDPLQAAYQERSNEILAGFWRARGRVELGSLDSPELPTRRDYAREFTKSHDARYYFLLLDNKPIRDVLWNELRPKGEDE